VALLYSTSLGCYLLYAFDFLWRRHVAIISNIIWISFDYSLSLPVSCPQTDRPRRWSRWGGWSRSPHFPGRSTDLRIPGASGTVRNAWQYISKNIVLDVIIFFQRSQSAWGLLLNKTSWCISVKTVLIVARSNYKKSAKLQNW
jgi:hypothetical protein